MTVRITAANRPTAVGAIAGGFADNEAWRWIVRSQRRLDRILPRYYGTMLRHVFEPLGTAFATTGGEGAALWLPPGVNGLTSRQRLAEVGALLPWATPAALRRAAELERLRKRHHPTEPHWYLDTLSVAPEHQRRGHGGALLRPMLDRCDADRAPSYLETQREANVPWYERFGYELVERVATRDGQRLWLMWREPS